MGKTGEGTVLEELARMRDGCPALKRILIPNDAWPKFKARVEAALKQPDTVGHNAIAYYALERGHLGRMCSPIHRYLLDGDAPKPKVDIEALQENWLRKETELGKHQRSKSFMGKLVELLFVEHLEAQAERIVALEAVERTGPDIVTERDGKRRSFEVKYLGRDDDGFMAIVESLKSEPQVQCGDLKGSINYVVFRVYEAAKQLQATPADGRNVAFVIDDQTLHTVELQLRREWIKWSAAKLYEDAGQKAKDFLEASRKDYPDLDKELAAVIRELEGITFVRLVDGFRFEPMFDVKLR